MNTRNRSGSLQLDDVKLLFAAFEERISKQLTNVINKISDIEKSMESIHANQIRLDNEINGMKAVIVNQQLYIEKIEAEKRRHNVVIHNVPEERLEFEEEQLDTDKEKIEFLSTIINDNDAHDPMIENVTRLGRKKEGSKRPLLVCFCRKADRDAFLFEQKKLRLSERCKASFDFLYVNRDSTLLMRKEEKRLREKLKTMRRAKADNDRIFIKNDKLYLNDVVIDSIDISKQLF